MSESSRGHFNGLLAAAVLPLALAACASDTSNTSSGSNAFYDRVQRNCGTMRMGRVSVNDLLSGPLQSVVFLNTVSQFKDNKMSSQAFAVATSTGLNVPRDNPAILCIIDQKTP